MTREEKQKALECFCDKHKCFNCPLVAYCDEVGTRCFKHLTDVAINRLYEEYILEPKCEVKLTGDQKAKADYDKEYEVFSNGFSVPISKELSQKIDKVINDQQAKADAGKAEIRLVPMEIVWAIAWIRMYGNRKYGDPENWKTVEPERYRDALMRHLLAYISDPKSVDEESGYPHLWHAACNMAFLMHFDYGEEVLHGKI